MIIRDYSHSDEQGWLRCRVVSFLDCSYWNDVKTTKEEYSHPTVSLVAEEQCQIVGLLDIELDSEDIAYPDNGRGAVLWHMAVLPEYRRQGIAARLWQEAEKRLVAQGITYCELWTQEDEAANRFYQTMGFVQQPQNSWIRCYAKWDDCYDLLDTSKIGEIYGAEEVVFQAAPSRKEELSKKCYRIDEVRLYSKKLGIYDLSQLFIDERYQGRGYGKAATQLVLDALKQDGKYGKVALCYVEGNDVAKQMYEKFGFVETERDGDEIVMERTL